MTNLSESTQASKNTTTNPCRILPLWGRKDLYPHVLHGEPLQLRQETVTKALGQCAASGEDNVAVEGLSQVQVGPVDGIDNDLVHAGVLEANDLGVEENLGGSKALRANLLYLG